MEALELLRYAFVSGGAGALLLVTAHMRTAPGQFSGRTKVLRFAGTMSIALMIGLLLAIVSGSPDFEYMLVVYALTITGGGYLGIGGGGRVATRIGRSPHETQIAELGGLIIGVVGALILTSLVEHALTDNGYLWDFSGLFGFINQLVLTSIGAGVLTIGVVRMLYNFRLLSERHRRDMAELEALKLREQASVAQLQRIQAQINPHFLYNALNGIAALVHREPDRAERMTLGLSRLFRASLSGDGSPLCTVREELDLVRTYLAIEEERFGERLKTAIAVDDAALDCRIPRFLLQPLVENAIKHGTSLRPDGGHIGVCVKQSEAQLIVEVCDDGAAFPELMLGGHGLKSVTDSLQLTTDGDFEVTMESVPRKCVRLRLPATL
jgi:sensor histidine kinase YesM